MRLSPSFRRSLCSSTSRPRTDTSLGYPSSMSAQPVHEADPDDPAEILSLLPAAWHAEFAAEYREALDAARDMNRWAQLRSLLHRWHLRAVAYSDPGFEAAMQAGRDARPGDMTPVPGLDAWRR
jgi:hypothetical protein